jgi:site-specific recombinase XerC
MASHPALADLAASFRRHLRAAGKADRTLVLYEQSIRFFCDWLAAQGRPTTLDQLTRHTIAAWLADLQERNAPGTLATRLRGLRRFCRWLVTVGELEVAPTEGLEMPAAPETSPDVLTPDEFAKLLRVCQVPRGKAGVFDRRIFEGRRDEALLRLLADTGLRVSELAGVEVGHLDLDLDRVWVVGKGRRPRDVTFGSDKTGESLDKFLRVRRLHPQAARSERLLLGQRGPMSPDGIRWRLEVLGEAAGIPGLHPHRFRHTRAHNWMDAGGSERGLMAQMGWRSDAMLSVYARSTQIQRSHDEAKRLARRDRD